MYYLLIIQKSFILIPLHGATLSYFTLKQQPTSNHNFLIVFISQIHLNLTKVSNKKAPCKFTLQGAFMSLG